ncbi:hypothetical protein Elgi_11200 [Paenibacillus elgii]|uniref:PdaC/SigV domain-containing protein n=1 Tax=Paenibacillus elgii TaxID=189691 RepID=UPI002D7AC297|nr:hypothetical protein Elgi_11200 [Paenibacillus elgii]
MLRKSMMISYHLLLTLSLGACNNGENSLPTTENIETRVPAANQQKPETSNDYQITGSNYSKSDDKFNYNIKYPQISGLSDHDKQKKINSILKDEALKVLKFYENPYASVELNIDYETVLKNTNMLSIQYSGLGSVSNAALPKEFCEYVFEWEI